MSTDILAQGMAAEAAAQVDGLLGPSGDLLSSDYMRASPGWSAIDLFGAGSLGEVWEISQETGKVDSPVNYIVGQTGYSNITQLTDANKPILRQRADGVCYLDFASGKSAAASGSAGIYDFLHSGTGGTIAGLVEWPATGADSKFVATAPSVSGTGIQVIKNTSENLQVYICRGTAGVYTVNQIDPRWPVGNKGLALVVVSYKQAGASDDLTISLDAGISPFTAATENAPNTGNAGALLSITNTFGGKLYALLAINRKLTKAETIRLFASWSAKYGYAFRPNLVIVAGGQSNMSGRGLISSTAFTPIEGAYTLDLSENYQLANEPSHSLLNCRVNTNPTEPSVTSPKVSPLFTLQKKLLTDYGVTSVGVPVAKGSTSLLQWDTPATVHDRTTLYGALVYRLRKVMRDKGGIPVLFWAGHEASAALASPNYTGGNVGTAYQTAFANFIAHLRADLGIDIPVVYTQLAPTDDLTLSLTHMAGAEAQRQCEALIPKAYMVPTFDLLRNAAGDDIHLSREAQIIVGGRASLAVAQHLLGLPVNGTGPRIASLSRSGAVITLTCARPISATAGNYGNLFRAYDNGVEATVSSAARHGSDPTKVLITLSAAPTGPVTLTYGYRAGLASAARTDFVADTDGLPLPVFGPLLVS